MGKGKFVHSFVFLLACCLLAAAIAVAGDSLKIDVSGQTLDYTISGEEVKVHGSGNTLVVNGPSSDFDVYGSGNAITINGDPRDLDVYGSNNVIRVNGHVEETDLRGTKNQVFCTSVEDVGFWGSDNLVEWSRGEKPDLKDRGARNQLRHKAQD